VVNSVPLVMPLPQAGNANLPFGLSYLVFDLVQDIMVWLLSSKKDASDFNLPMGPYADARCECNLNHCCIILLTESTGISE